MSLVRIIVFVSGWVLMSLEILGGRVLGPYFGNDVFVWGSLISTFLVALSLGYAAGGLLSRRWPRLEPLCGIVAAAGILTAVLPTIQDPVNSYIFDAVPDPRGGPLTAAVTLFFVPSFLLGLVSPYAVQLAAQSLETVGLTSGHLFALSTVGSTLGTLATTFFLIPSWGVHSIIQTMGASLAGLGVVALLWSRRRAALPAMLALLLLAGGTAWAQDDEKILSRRDSLYTTVVVTQQGPYRLMKFRLKGSDMEESRCDVHDPLRLVHEYTELMLLGLAFQPEPRDVLVLGLGGASLSKCLAHYYPDATIDNVEFDPEVVRCAREYFFYRDTPHMRVFEQDARAFVRRSKKKYDVIFLDAFLGLEIPFHLKTREFYQVLQAHLNPGGVVVTNLHRGPRLYSSERRTLAAAFPENYAFGGVTQGNAVIIARAGPGGPWPTSRILDGIKSVLKKHPFPYNLTRDVSKMIPTPDWDSSAPLLTDDYAPVEMLRQR